MNRLQQLARRRTEPLARLRPAHADLERRAPAAARRGRDHRASPRTRASSARRSAARPTTTRTIDRIAGPTANATSRSTSSSSSRSRTSRRPPTSCVRCTSGPRARDGFVSFEVDPRLAHDAAGSLDAARRLFAADRPSERDDQDPRHRRVRARDRGCDRRPGSTSTSPCCSPSRRTSASPRRTCAVSSAGWTPASRSTGSPRSRRSSSRGSTPPSTRMLPDGSPLRGTAAIANAKLAYERFRAIFSGERWERLRAAGRERPAARSGPRPRRRTPRTATRCTSRSSSVATRSTRCR